MNVVRNIEATCASALPTRSRSSRGPRESARRPRQGSPLPQICSDGTASRRLNILPRYTSTDKICRSFVNYKKVRRKTIFQFVKMIIRLLSHTFFILTFITSSGIFGYFGDLQYLEIPNFPNIRMLSLAFGKGIANLRKTKSYLRLIFGLSSGKALDK